MSTSVEIFWSKITSSYDFIALGNKFFLYLELSGQAKESIYSKKLHLKSFILWCQQREIYQPSEVTFSIMDTYQTFLFTDKHPKTGRPLSVGHRRNRLTTLKIFFNWLIHNSYILKNPADCIETVKEAQHLPRNIFTVEEIEKIMLVPDLSTLIGKRARVIIELAYATAMRRMELHNLNIDDIDLGRNTIFIKNGKGKKDRVIPLGKRAKYWIIKHINEIRPLFNPAPEQKAFFITTSGARLHRSEVSKYITRAIKKSKIGKAGSCHNIRHSVATLMIENGAEIRYVQEFLGHSKLYSTQIYTRVSIAKLKEIHMQTHPARMSPTKTKEILNEINE